MLVIGCASLSPRRCGKFSMEVCRVFVSGAAINRTISTDREILLPDLVSISICPTAIGWGDVCSAPKGAIFTCSVLVGLKLSLVAISMVINEHWEPSSKRILPWVRNPLALIGAIAVFNKLIVLEAELCLGAHEP